MVPKVIWGFGKERTIIGRKIRRQTSQYGIDIYLSMQQKHMAQKSPPRRQPWND